MRTQLLGIGILAPGLSDWDTAAEVLRGERSYAAGPIQTPPPAILTPNERRRSTLATRLALEAARQATTQSGLPESSLRSVFASSDGDMGLIDSMCQAIYQHGSAPSPTVFQNSVNNAVAGYWSIAASCLQASNSVTAGDGSFAAGLLEAVTQVNAEGVPVLLVAFDVQAPPLLHPHRPLGCAFACALVLGPDHFSPDHPRLILALRKGGGPCSETPIGDDALEAIRNGNPAARSLSLLSAVANAEPGPVHLHYWPDLQLEVSLESA